MINFCHTYRYFNSHHGTKSLSRLDCYIDLHQMRLMKKKTIFGSNKFKTHKFNQIFNFQPFNSKLRERKRKKKLPSIVLNSTKPPLSPFFLLVAASHFTLNLLFCVCVSVSPSEFYLRMDGWMHACMGSLFGKKKRERERKESKEVVVDRCMEVWK